MAEVSIQSVVRTILAKDIELPTKEVIRRAKLRGVEASDESITNAIYILRPKLRKEGAGAVPVKVVAAAARETTPSKPAAPATPAAAADLQGVLGNVALVNKIVGVCGGIENARQTAEAVETCGGLQAFLKQLELVAEIRASKEG